MCPSENGDRENQITIWHCNFKGISLHFDWYASAAECQSSAAVFILEEVRAVLWEHVCSARRVLAGLVRNWMEDATVVVFIS